MTSSGRHTYPHLNDAPDLLWETAEAIGNGNRLVVVGSYFSRTPYYNDGNAKEHQSETVLQLVTSGHPAHTRRQNATVNDRCGGLGMSNGTEKEIRELRQQVEQLQHALNQEEEAIRTFGSGLDEVNTALLSLNDKNFDGNVYRKALEHTFKEYVYTKIRNLFGAIALVAGIGGFFFVEYSIDTIVENKIKEQQSEFVEASTRLTRQRLVSLLRQLAEAQPEHQPRLLNEIQSEEALFLPLVREFITATKDPQRRDLALSYAGLVRDKDLLDQIYGVLDDGDSEQLKAKALVTLLEYLPDSSVAEKIEDALESASPGGHLWLEATRFLSLKTFDAKAAAELRNNTMKTALLESKRREVFRAAVLSFVVDEREWDPEYRPAIPDSDSYTQLILGHPNYQKKSPSEKVEFLDTEIGNAKDPYMRELLATIRAYVGLSQLRRGDASIMQKQLEKRDQPIFPIETWTALVQGYFPGFTASARTREGERRVGRLVDIEAIPVDIRAAQYELWSELKGWKWSETRKLFEDPQALSIAALRQGRRDSFVALVSGGYYDEDNWRDVLALFPSFRDQIPPGDRNEQGWQDVLLASLGDYTFDEAAQLYTYQDPQGPSIEALKAGHTDALRNIISRGYYDSGNWRDVLALFPYFRQLIPDDQLDEPSWQDELLATLENYVFDAATLRYTYQDPQQPSIDALKTG